jgi:hypothetical protein
MKNVSEMERPAEQMLSPLETEAKESLRDEMARRFGQIAIRHRHGEIPQADYENLRQIYFDKVNDGQSFDGDELEVELAKFDQRVDNMWLLAQADIWDAKVELGSDTLPEYVSHLNEPLSNDELLHKNLELVEKNNLLVRTAGDLLLRATTAEKEYDDLLSRHRQLEQELALVRQSPQVE